ncbi:hypothetical protein HYPSUDRAFT_73865 [Hypholoma sublateritium FD-334 SS-4]|uniref:Uncharacterized protein n=1 Tax=Hypholoma sublateritium (strain FD-334 SS-4) TaxID=945553 RepID=A0A0D2PM68_HYPSF|nr:hypothetical protein HYPSUDRAFT_73865 [Hypholoma sublateritium FD-334 SS-4]
MSSPKPMGLAQIFGTVKLSNMRSAIFQSGSTRVLVDAVFNVVDGDEPMLWALLRLDASSDGLALMQQIDTRPLALACLCAKVSTMTESSIRPELLTRGRKWKDYAFIGDVDQVALVDLGTMPDDEVNQVFLQTRSNFHFTGTVTASNTLTTSFYVEPSFHMPAFPAHCFPSAANKELWAQKPLPPLGSLVTVEGYLDQVRRCASKAVTLFEIQVEEFRVFKPPRMVSDPGPHATCHFHHVDDVYGTRRNVEGAYQFRVAAAKHPFYLTHFEKGLIGFSKVIRESFENRKKLL